jgi:ribonuclease P protein component
MLPKKNVIKTSSEINKIFKKGQTFKSPFFILKFLKNETKKDEVKTIFMV